LRFEGPMQLAYIATVPNKYIGPSLGIARLQRAIPLPQDDKRGDRFELKVRT
jgi:hypothetical protein